MFTVILLPAKIRQRTGTDIPDQHGLIMVCAYRSQQLCFTEQIQPPWLKKESSWALQDMYRVWSFWIPEPTPFYAHRALRPRQHEIRARIFKILRSPRIDSKEPIRQAVLPGGPERQPYSYSVPSSIDSSTEDRCRLGKAMTLASITAQRCQYPCLKLLGLSIQY